MMMFPDLPAVRFALGLLVSSAVSTAAEIHVRSGALPEGDGTWERPYRTIMSAAAVAQPGDVITVHAGTYRERIDPPRGGSSPDARITYRAAPGETVIIKGSEIVKAWVQVKDDIWKVSLPNTFFGSYNPYRDVIAGDWFEDRGRVHHTGEVYLDGVSLYEAASLEEVMNPQLSPYSQEPEHSRFKWYVASDERETHITANFGGANPNEKTVEINVREACFYPSQPGRNYITVRGFTMAHAATQWAAPTAEQIGLIGTHWSKGWIIEDNVVRDSKCVGITLGKDRATGHNEWSKDPSKDGALHYNEMIQRALEAGWSRENIGSHIVRRNTLYNCEQAGICGSFGAIFSEISDNHIYRIWHKRSFTGMEQAGIKIHGAVDTLIARNHVHHASRGIWLDWMTQGARVTGNLCHDNSIDDLYIEVSHGPYIVDNNVLLSPVSLNNLSHGGAYLYNLFAGAIHSRQDFRITPYLEAHGTAVAGMSRFFGGDDRFFHNVFLKPERQPVQERPGVYRTVGYGLWVLDNKDHPLTAAGNVYVNGARPSRQEKDVRVVTEPQTDPLVWWEQGDLHLRWSLPADLPHTATPRLSTAGFPDTLVSRLSFAGPDGEPVHFETDYFGRPRDRAHPTPGPFERRSTADVERERRVSLRRARAVSDLEPSN